MTPEELDLLHHLWYKSDFSEDIPERLLPTFECVKRHCPMAILPELEPSGWPEVRSWAQEQAWVNQILHGFDWENFEFVPAPCRIFAEDACLVLEWENPCWDARAALCLDTQGHLAFVQTRKGEYFRSFTPLKHYIM